MEDGWQDSIASPRTPFLHRCSKNKGRPVMAPAFCRYRCVVIYREARTLLFAATLNFMRVPDASRRLPFRVLSIEFVPAEDEAEADDPMWIRRTGVDNPRFELAPSVFCVVAPTAPPACPKVDPAAPTVEPTVEPAAPPTEPTAPPTPPSIPPPPPPAGAATGAGIEGISMELDPCSRPRAESTEVRTVFNCVVELPWTS